jgi:5-methylcytosine-specific restriction protein A
MEHLLNNIRTFDNYLVNERQWARDHIFEGICFVAYKVAGETRFAPSRFLGYINNNINDHDLNPDKHGGESNKAINNILEHEPEENEEMLKLYFAFCDSIGVEKQEFGAFNCIRKFWENIIIL